MKLRSTRTRLSDILVRAGLLDAQGVARALDRQQMQPGKLGSQLLKLGLVTEDDLAKALSVQFGVPPFLSVFSDVDPAAIERLPEPVAKRCLAVPLVWEADRGVLHVVMADPQDLRRVDEVRFASGARKVLVQVAPETVVERLLARHYDGVEPPPAPPAPDISVALASSETPRSSEPRPTRTARDALVVDPDPRRRRAMGALLEASGFRVTRASNPDEGAQLAASRTWSAVWAHEDWSENLPGAKQVYADPLATLANAGAPLEALKREALELAESAGQRLPGDQAAEAKKAVSLVRFLAARGGIEGLRADCLALRTWRTALGSWEEKGTPAPLPGDEIVTATIAYEKSLLAGRSPAEAAQSLRTDPSLDPNAVTSLIRWAVGENLLSRFEAPPRLLLLLEAEPAARFGSQLTGAGWDVVGPGSGADAQGRWDAVLADLASGLPRVEAALAHLPPDQHPPVFLLVANLNGPDVMYALKSGAEDVLSFDTHPEVLETKLRRAASRRAPDQGLVTGNLRDMSLADMLQILSNGLKTAVVRLNGPGGAGEIALDGGALVDARAGDVEGDEALYAMIAWEEGDFRILPGEKARGVTLAGSTEGLLMEGFRRLDEGRHHKGSNELPEA